MPQPGSGAPLMAAGPIDSPGFVPKCLIQYN